LDDPLPRFFHFCCCVEWKSETANLTENKKIALDGPLRNVCLLCWSEIIGKLFTWFQTWLRCSLEHSLPNTCILCTSKIQDGRQTEWGKEWTIFLKLENWIRPKPMWIIIGGSLTKFSFFVWIGNNSRWLQPQYKVLKWDHGGTINLKKYTDWMINT
jgi:hypothetical protein